MSARSTKYEAHVNSVARLITVFGDALNDEVFKERLGAISVKQLSRTAKERHSGFLGYAEAMVIEYNGRKKHLNQCLSLTKLYDNPKQDFLPVP